MTWKAIAIVGIWAGVGVSAFGPGTSVGSVAFFAMVATIFVVDS